MAEMRFKSARDVVQHGLRTMGIDVGSGVDSNSKVAISSSGGGNSVAIDNKNYRYYPWGKNNKLPGEVIALLRSNADMQNLLKTRADFLFGGGLGVFKYIQDGNDLVMVPVWNHDLMQFFLEKEIDQLADAYYTNIVELANAWIDVDVKKDGDVFLRGVDSSVVRTVIPDAGKKVGQYLVSTKWDGAGKKEAAVYPAFEFEMVKDGFKKAADSMLHIRPFQLGQFWYGHAAWTALEKHIKLANRIPDIHTAALDTEGNVGMIIRVADKYFSDMIGKYKKENGDDFTIEELKEEFDKATEGFLFGDGKRKTITDVCGYDPVTGKLQKYIEFEPIKKSVSGEEYIKLAGYAVSSMSNGSSVLSGLSGVSDNKMNSGGGTEIRISAEYQQFYRTPRERSQFLNALNRTYRVIMMEKGLLNEGEFIAHKNILLQTLDVNKKGVAEVADASGKK